MGNIPDGYTVGPNGALTPDFRPKLAMTTDKADAVERVARALWEQEFGTEGKWPVNVGNPDEWREMARAALAAANVQPLPDDVRERLERACARAEEEYPQLAAPDGTVAVQFTDLRALLERYAKLERG